MVRSNMLLFTFLVLISPFGSTSSLQTANAAQPCVQFDVVQIADAMDTTPVEFLKANPDEKLIRIRLPISSLVKLGSEDSLVQYLYVLSGSSESPFQVVDYAPKTTLASDVAGPISIENNTGSSMNVGLKAVAPQDFAVRADASASRNASSSNSSRLQKLPPKQLIAASGTMHRGVSAYFKLKPSSQTTLEGDKLFEITARVPFNWRAGLMQVNCMAFAKPRGVSPPFEGTESVCGRSRFLVGIYLAGDESAKHSVWKLAQAQQQLRSLARQHSDVIEDQKFPSLGHKLGAALSVVKPRIPTGWLDQLLVTDDFQSFERHLPRKIRMAATEYREARKQVHGFAG